MTRYCDHVFITVKELEKRNPQLDTFNNIHSKDSTAKPMTEAIMTTPDYIEGQLLICHFCGKGKEVWEDGSIVEIKAP